MEHGLDAIHRLDADLEVCEALLSYPVADFATETPQTAAPRGGRQEYRLRQAGEVDAALRA